MKNKYLLILLMLFLVRLMMDYFFPNDVFEFKRDVLKSAGYAIVMTGVFWLIQKGQGNTEKSTE